MAENWLVCAGFEINRSISENRWKKSSLSAAEGYRETEKVSSFARIF